MNQRANTAGVRTGYGTLNLGDLVEGLSVGQVKSAHTKRMPRFLEKPLNFFPTTVFLVIV